MTRVSADPTCVEIIGDNNAMHKWPAPPLCINISQTCPCGDMEQCTLIAKPWKVPTTSQPGTPEVCYIAHCLHEDFFTPTIWRRRGGGCEAVPVVL